MKTYRLHMCSAGTTYCLPTGEYMACARVVQRLWPETRNAAEVLLHISTSYQEGAGWERCVIDRLNGPIGVIFGVTFAALPNWHHSCHTGMKHALRKYDHRAVCWKKYEPAPPS